MVEQAVKELERQDAIDTLIELNLALLNGTMQPEEVKQAAGLLEQASATVAATVPSTEATPVGETLSKTPTLAEVVPSSEAPAIATGV